jgi:hypothetical protein
MDPSKSWASLPLQVSAGLEAFFSMTVTTEIGDGTITLFWQDRWLFRQRISDLAPLISGLIPRRIAKQENSSLRLD